MSHLPDCDGIGAVPCPMCDGEGNLCLSPFIDPYSDDEEFEACAMCAGTGEIQSTTPKTKDR